jgi:hypothetical protein
MYSRLRSPGFASRESRYLIKDKTLESQRYLMSDPSVGRNGEPFYGSLGDKTATTFPLIERAGVSLAFEA